MRFSAFCMSHVQVYVGALLVFHLLMVIAGNVSLALLPCQRHEKVHKLQGIQKLKNFFPKLNPSDFGCTFIGKSKGTVFHV